MLLENAKQQQKENLLYEIIICNNSYSDFFHMVFFHSLQLWF